MTGSFSRANTRGLPKGWFSKRVVLADVLPERKPERGNIRMFPQNENRNEGTFACSPGTITGTRAHSPKPPFYETALSSPRQTPRNHNPILPNRSFLGSQHPSPNAKTLCNFEPQIWPEIITSRDAESACFKGSGTSCDVIVFCIFRPSFGRKRSHHVMDASCRICGLVCLGGRLPVAQ